MPALLIELEQTVYNVDMTCQSCVDSVKSALSKLDGIHSFDIDLNNKRVSVEASIPPSLIIKSIQDTGRDAIIRGTGKPNSAAVAILESFAKEDALEPVKGLARIVATADSKLLVDITLNGLQKGTYYPSFRTSGNISNGAHSTGASILNLPPVEVGTPSDKAGLFSGQSFASANLKISDLIGRSFIVSSDRDGVTNGSLAGVIARSAGVWENDKHVCSCTGKTIWQERQDAYHKGITV